MPSAGAGAPVAGYGSSAAPLPVVYLGATKPKIKVEWDSGDFTKRPTGSHTKAAPVQAALAKFDKMDAKEQRNTLRLLAIAGFTSSFVKISDVDEYVQESTLDEGREAYKNLLETASDYFMSSGLQVTPEDVLRSRVAYRLKGSGIQWDGNLDAFDDGLGSKAKEADNRPKPGTYTTTATSIDFMNPQDARNLVRGTLQQELGRDPTQGEYEDFLSAIHAAEREDPSTQKTTSTYVLDKNDNLRLSDQQTVSHQGIGSAGLQQLAYEKAQRQPGWAEWQAMGTYAPALFQALGATVSGV